MHIEYLAVLPQNRKAGLYKILVSKLAEELFPGREISITTYRENDRADTGYRKYAGRTVGLLSSMYYGAMPLGMAVFGPMADRSPIQGIMIGAGIAVICCGLVLIRE